MSPVLKLVPQGKSQICQSPVSAVHSTMYLPPGGFLHMLSCAMSCMQWTARELGFEKKPITATDTA